MHQHDIKAAWRQCFKTHQVMPGGKHNAPLLRYADAATGTAVRSAGALAHFNKNKCAVRRGHDEVNLAAAAARCFKVLRQKLQTRALQMRKCPGLSCIACCLGGTLGRRCLHTLIFGKPH